MSLIANPPKNELEFSENREILKNFGSPAKVFNGWQKLNSSQKKLGLFLEAILGKNKLSNCDQFTEIFNSCKRFLLDADFICLISSGFILGKKGKKVVEPPTLNKIDWELFCKDTISGIVGTHQNLNHNYKIVLKKGGFSSSEKDLQYKFGVFLSLMGLVIVKRVHPKFKRWGGGFF